MQRQADAEDEAEAEVDADAMEVDGEDPDDDEDGTPRPKSKKGKAKAKGKGKARQKRSAIDSYTGVSIKVSFNSKSDEGLRIQQLSGGQKSLVALAMGAMHDRCLARLKLTELSRSVCHSKVRSCAVLPLRRDRRQPGCRSANGSGWCVSHLPRGLANCDCGSYDQGTIGRRPVHHHHFSTRTFSARR